MRKRVRREHGFWSRGWKGLAHAWRRLSGRSRSWDEGRLARRARRFADAFLTACVTVLEPPRRWLRTLTSFRQCLQLVKHWWQSRNPLALVQGAPALLAVVGLLAVAAVLARASAERVRLRYEQEAQQAWYWKKFERAKLCFQRLARSNPDQPSYRFGLALCEGELGNVARTWGIMRGLADADRAGYPPAHLWQVRQLLRRSHVSTGELQIAERHLLRALETQPDFPEADALLGQLYLVRNEPDDAERHLKRVSSYGEPLLLLARVHASQGKQAEARAEAAVALRYFHARAASQPDNVPARLHWAEAAVLLDQFVPAIRILEEGLRSPPTPAPAYRLALAQTYVRWSQVAGLQGAAHLDRRLLLVQRALQFDHGNVQALGQMLALVRPKAPDLDSNWEEVRQRLTRVQDSESVAFALGLCSHAEGKHADAREHFLAAVRGAPVLARVLNNLAWIQAHSEPKDPAQALHFIDAVLQLEPEDPHYRDTRGQILARLGRWEEAVTDLEAAHAALPQSRERQELLKEAFRHLGRDWNARERPKVTGAVPSNL